MKRPSRRTGRAAASLLLALCAGACGGTDEGRVEAAADSLTRRQKDSIVSTMPIPGAGVVGRALRASDAAAERAARHDAIAR